jgi:D-alanyl-lipoteichoic acid acyltransferase DltB (MBOAT superfamily)
VFFNSVTFIVFFILVTIIYWNINLKYRWIFLVFSSCIFYGFWRWEFLGLIFFSASLDFILSKKIYSEKNSNRRKIYLVTSIVINLLILFYFKYTYFIIDNLSVFVEVPSGIKLNFMNLILPFGISFYTFETISYTVDVYRRLIPAQKNFIRYSLFVTFFPKLVAGPIQRTSEFLDQLDVIKKFNINLFVLGLKRVLDGLFLKVVLADNLSSFVDSGFNMSTDLLSAIDVTILSMLFGFQIYFDFAGYSSIAIGCALILGFKIPENFNFPYISTSFKEFWKRWHISLSSWIRDYLYLPLIGVKVEQTTATGGIGTRLNTKNLRSKTTSLYITWAIMGLWHGANWTFVMWGLIHATLIYVERKIKEIFTISLNNFFLWPIVFFFSMLSWIPFRAESIKISFEMYSKFFDFNNYLFMSLRENNALIIFCLIISFLIIHYFNSQKKYLSILIINFLDIIKYSIIIILVFTFLRPVEQFIYFQF